jgi:hypothetical protein
MNADLFGVIEWINEQGGSVKTFNPGILYGTVHGLVYRYFILEGWIALMPNHPESGLAIECLSVTEFKNTVIVEEEKKRALLR